MLNSLLNMLNPYTVGLNYIIPFFVKHVKQKKYFNYFCVKHVYTPTLPTLLPFPPQVRLVCGLFSAQPSIIYMLFHLVIDGIFLFFWVFLLSFLSVFFLYLVGVFPQLNKTKKIFFSSCFAIHRKTKKDFFYLISFPPLSHKKRLSDFGLI